MAPKPDAQCVGMFSGIHILFLARVRHSQSKYAGGAMREFWTKVCNFPRCSLLSITDLFDIVHAQFSTFKHWRLETKLSESQEIPAESVLILSFMICNDLLFMQIRGMDCEAVHGFFAGSKRFG